MDINRLVQQELSWLARQEAPVANKLVDIYQQTWQDVTAQLAKQKNFNSYTAHQLRATQAQLGALIDGMHQQHSQLLGGHVKSVYQTQLVRDGKTLANLEAAFGDPQLAEQFKNITPAINQRAIRHLVTTQNISIKGFSADLQRQVRNVVAIAHARGEGIDKVVGRLEKIQGLPTYSPSRLRLIARMETARASNKAKVDHIKELQRQYPDREYWLMAKDRVDKTNKTRNHWLSWAISGTVRCVTRREYYEVSTTQLNAAKAEYKNKTGKKASDSGVLWKPGGVGRRGKGLPAHFWDRGTEIPWDPSWEGDAFGEVKHPQGPIEQPKTEPEAKPEHEPKPEKEKPKSSEPLLDETPKAEQEQKPQSDKPTTPPDKPKALPEFADLPIGNYDIERFKKFKPPSRRHFLKSMTKPKDKNSLVAGIKPGVIRAEVRQIHSGLAHRMTDSNFLIPESGRVFEHDKVHFLPLSGAGIYMLNREQYKLLAQFVKDKENGEITLQKCLEKGLITEQDAELVLFLLEKYLGDVP